MSFKKFLEDWQRWSRDDVWWQGISKARCCDAEGAITNGTTRSAYIQLLLQICLSRPVCISRKYPLKIEPFSDKVVAKVQAHLPHIVQKVFQRNIARGFQQSPMFCLTDELHLRKKTVIVCCCF